MQQPLCQTFADKAKPLVSGYNCDLLNMLMYWHSWNTQDETCLDPGKHADFECGSTDANGAPAICASGALMPCNLDPDVGRLRESCESIDWNFRFFNMTRLLVRFRSAGGDLLSPLFTFQTISDRCEVFFI